MRLLSLPNVLSLLRLPLAAAFVVADSIPERVAIVIAVSVSDFADGFLARRMRSHDLRSGQLVDPVTDKLFVLIALLAFVARREISVGTLLIVVARDIYNAIAFFVLKALRWPVDFKARLSGKTVTVLQLALLLALLFWNGGVRPLVGAVAITSLIAIADYTQAALRKRRAAAT